MQLYPIQFNPILKERIWGGTKLKTVLNKEITSDITGKNHLWLPFHLFL